jgi:hypothetical protein
MGKSTKARKHADKMKKRRAEKAAKRALYASLRKYWLSEMLSPCLCQGKWNAFYCCISGSWQAECLQEYMSGLARTPERVGPN